MVQPSARPLALVTGGSSGIGRGCAETLAACEGLDAHAAAVRIRRQAAA